MTDHSEMESVAQALVRNGKGLLAADESFSTIKRRFDAIGVESTEDQRRAYRNMLFTTPGIEEFISGIILFDETIRQSTLDGVPFPKYLAQRGILPGIKVDRGAKNLANFPGEKITEGLDGLRERLAEYYQLGAKFTKWRAVIVIGEGTPTQTAIDSNAEVLARYAALSQEAGLVPVVEPEVLMEGNHNIEDTEAVTIAVLWSVFTALQHHLVVFDEMLLKPNMVVPGKDSSMQAGAEEVARATLRALSKTVPPVVPGIAFLSGGQGAEQATQHLNLMNKLGPHPWKLTFSFSRALQEPPMAAWGGRQQNVKQAQDLFYRRARLNSLASMGEYIPEMEKAAA